MPGAARSRIRRADVRAALAGATAAATWAAAEPLAQRLFRTPYSDVRLLGAPISQRHWRAIGLTIHLVNGAAAGIAFNRLGLRGWRAGVAVFQVENLVAWPLTVVVDRFHPDRRSGAWPPLLRNGRVFGQEAAVHALFGAVLGSIVDRAPRNS